MEKIKLRLEKGKSEHLGPLHFRLEKVYNVGKYTLRGKILIESPISCRAHLLSLSNKTQSVISAVGYSVIITGLDVDSQSAIIEINFR